MKLQLDPNKTYALALEGGGAKGAYEIGVWRALCENHIRLSAVAGVSVGALNGAMIAMGDLERAEAFWRNIRFSQVMDVPDRLMQKLFDGDFDLREVGPALRLAADVLRDKGFDVEPLKGLLREAIDEQAVRASPLEFYLVTYSLTDRKSLDLDAKKLPEGALHDMLLASAYFPAFKNEPLRGKRYIDGGVQDAVPVDSLVSRGYKDLIVVRLYGFGVEKKVVIPKDTTVCTVRPWVDLGRVLLFSPEQAERDLRLGYYDGLRALYGLAGRRYYIDRRWSEDEAYARLRCLAGPAGDLRRVNEEILPRLARELGARGDYHDVLLALLELGGAELGIDPFVIRTEQQLWDEVLAAYRAGKKRKLSKTLSHLRWALKQEELSDEHE